MKYQLRITQLFTKDAKSFQINDLVHDAITEKQFGKAVQAFNSFELNELDCVVMMLDNKNYAVRFGKAYKTKELQDAARNLFSSALYGNDTPLVWE